MESRRTGERVQWDAIWLADDADLAENQRDLAGRQPAPTADVCAQLFRCFQVALSPHAETHDPRLEVTARDFASSGSTPLHAETNALLMFESPDGAWRGLQYQREAVVFRRGVIASLALLLGHPAKGGGGFDIEGTFSDAVPSCDVASSMATAGGGRVSLYDRTFRFGVHYHLSEAGAFRLLRFLLAFGECVEASVRLREYSDV